MSVIGIFQSCRMKNTGGEETTNPIKASIIQTNPSIHPVVVSPLKALQSSTKPSENGFPATKAVNRINANAAT